MSVTDRMLEGAIASNPAQPDKAGEYRYCFGCESVFLARPRDAGHREHASLALPALNPDGSERLIKAFKAFMRRWPAERQAVITQLAERRGWELAHEHQSGGGALTDDEVAAWRTVIDAELKRLVAKARAQIALGAGDGQPTTTQGT